MLFDTLCKFVEIIHGQGNNDFTSINNDLRQAARFNLEFGDYEIDDKEVEFILPFDAITVEDSLSCTLLSKIPGQLEIDSKDSKGISYKSVKDVNTNDGHIFFVNSFSLTKQNEYGIIIGTFQVKDKRFVNEIKILHRVIFLPNEDNRIIFVKDVKKDFPIKSITDTIEHICKRILFINQPSKFVVEVIPKKVREINSKLIPRTHERSYFTLLSPAEIKRRYIPDGWTNHEKLTGNKVTPHYKRGHYRRFYSDRFINKKGQRIWVDACWVGPTEAMVGNKKYKVRLDI